MRRDVYLGLILDCILLLACCGSHRLCGELRLFGLEALRRRMSVGRYVCLNFVDTTGEYELTLVKWTL